MQPDVTRWCSAEASALAFKGRLVQYVGRILRPCPGKDVVEVHDYHHTDTGVLASSLTKRAAGYTSLAFPIPKAPAPTAGPRLT